MASLTTLRVSVSPDSSVLFCDCFCSGAAARQHRAAERNRGRGADIGAGRHGRDGAGISDIGAGAGGARAARRHKSDDRHRRRQDRADDLAHRRVEPARRVHAQHDDGDVVRRRAVQFPHHIVGNCGTDRAVDIEHQSAFGGSRRHGERCKQLRRKQRVASNLAKSTITARRRIMAIFPGRRPRWRNMDASYLGRAGASRKAVTTLRPLAAGRRSVARRTECAARRGLRSNSIPAYRRTRSPPRSWRTAPCPATHIAATRRSYSAPDKDRSIGGLAIETPRMFGGEM